MALPQQDSHIPTFIDHTLKKSYIFSVYPRLINPSKKNSFFLFGARGTGKTTFLEKFFAGEPVLKVDLLDPVEEELFSLHPEELSRRIESRGETLKWIVLDEIQKCPKLLNLVHQHIEKRKLRFALTGSSARRLKQKGVNLLAGRAFTEYLFPLTHREFGDVFNLGLTLEYGSLPKISQFEEDSLRKDFLRSYALNYIKTEIQAEGWVRKLDPFRKFLEVAAQMNGQIVNYSQVAHDCGVDVTTVQNYYDILIDTLLGFEVEAYDRSVRKRQNQGSKFYLFDCGVKRAIDKTLHVPLVPSTLAYGAAFEHFLVTEIVRLSHYRKTDYEFFYLRTKDGAEIDLIVKRPGLPTALVEIKSKNYVDERDGRSLIHFSKDFPKAELFILSNDPNSKKMDRVEMLPWKTGIERLGV